jgi:hypothetical protein
MPHASLDEEMTRIERVTLQDLGVCLRDFPLRPVVTGQMTNA